MVRTETFGGVDFKIEFKYFAPEYFEQLDHETPDNALKLIRTMAVMFPEWIREIGPEKESTQIQED